MPTTETPSRPVPEESPRPRLQLSATQVVASGLAAITATFIASFFGLSGTIIGAAVASMATVTGNAVYGHSLRRTQERVRRAVPISLANRGAPGPTAPPAGGALPAVGAPGEARRAEPRPHRARRSRRGASWQRFALGAVGLFVVVVGAVTAVELAAGRPLERIVRHESGHGTTFFGGTNQNANRTPPANGTATPTPTTSPSGTPGHSAPPSTQARTTPTTSPTHGTATPTTPPPSTPATGTGTPQTTAPSAP